MRTAIPTGRPLLGLDMVVLVAHGWAWCRHSHAVDDRRVHVVCVVWLMGLQPSIRLARMSKVRLGCAFCSFMPIQTRYSTRIRRQQIAKTILISDEVQLRIGN